MWADDAVLVPHETLDTERKEQIREQDTEKLFKHGGSFPAIHISDLLELLEKKGLLEDLIEECRAERWDLDQEIKK
jgi:hypothetical protein